MEPSIREIYEPWRPRSWVRVSRPGLGWTSHTLTPIHIRADENRPCQALTWLRLAPFPWCKDPGRIGKFTSPTAKDVIKEAPRHGKMAVFRFIRQPLPSPFPSGPPFPG